MNAMLRGRNGELAYRRRLYTLLIIYQTILQEILWLKQ